MNFVATERDALGKVALHWRRARRERTSSTAPDIADDLKSDERNAEENAASNGKFFDVESKTIVTIGKYEKDQ